jgi:O-antigen/teichoic acid export membrane protein
MVSIVAFCALAGTIPTVLRVWLGQAAPHTDLILPIVLMLGIGYCADNVASVASTILRAIGRPRFETLYQVMSATINIGLTLLLAWRFGVIGVLTGMLLGALISSVVFLRLVGQDFEAAGSRFIAPWLVPLGVTGALAAGVTYAFGAILPADAPRGIAVLMLAAQVAIYLAVVALGFRIARVLDASDVARLRAALPPSLLNLASRVRKYAV